VVSARGKATDELDDILTIAAKMEITNHFESLKRIKRGFDAVDFSTEFDKLDKLLN
jgi:hypothetical protein